MVESSPGANAHIPIALSSASVYPLNVHDAFAVSHDLGYDGVEVLVTGNQIYLDGMCVLLV